MKRLAMFLLVTACIGWTSLCIGADTITNERSASVSRSGASNPGRVGVYAHGHFLVPGDKLQDGPDGAEITLDGKTLLLWVDRKPQGRFPHETAYILVSAAGVRVLEGERWPVLNGSRILYGKINGATISSPLSIPDDADGNIFAHIYPEELSAEDRLKDGEFSEEAIAILSGSTFFMWIDMLPAAFFAHPTVYILVSADKRIRVLDGCWWPGLNGKRIFYGERSDYGVSFPFWLR
ncbi:MAG: hypothetical protein JXA73_08100 [Acidobacteria bacterium]|nr:hypothetical protein [Acidobacteriota bacterium]